MAVYKNEEKTKDGRVWYFTCYKKDFNGNNIKYKSKKYLTKKEATDEERIFLFKRNNTTNINFNLVSKEYFKEIDKTKKGSTVYTYLNAFNKNIKQYFENKNINDIDLKYINFWKTKLEEKDYSIKYLNKMYDILKNIFDFSIKNYGIEKNIVEISGRFQKKNEEIINDCNKIKYLSKENFNIFIKSVDDNMWKTFFVLLFYSGMRKGEVQALKWKDVDFIKNEIIINKSLTVKVVNEEGYKITSTKTGLNRVIKMNNLLNNQLYTYKEFVKKYADFCDDWFVFGNTRYLPQTTIDRIKHKYFDLSGITEITIHEFRHSHVSLLINEYIKSGQTDTTKFFLMMSNRMGHSIEVMQRTYMHLFPSIQDEIVDILNNI